MCLHLLFMKHTHLLIHYSEIAIKKDNRSFFEETLVNNIRDVLKEISIFKRYGRIVGVLKEDSDLFAIEKSLKKIPGIYNFSFCNVSSQDLEDIKKTTREIAKSISFSNFRISSKRSFKGFKYTSQEIDRLVGEEIFENLKKEVKLKEPELDIKIEVTEKETFIYTNKNIHKGIGGLPVGSTGKVFCSLSGGIDSPVSGYLLNKRGCKVVYVHIQSNNQVTKEVEEKIFKLCSVLREFQGDTKLIIVPFSEIQKELLICVPSDYRMIIYRRFMLRIMNKLYEKENVKAIITGDSVGQVASQTLENLACIYQASALPIFSPLIAFNKEEIISLSKEIGTYDISIIPYPDCCSFMVSVHPKTKGQLQEVFEIEKNIKNIEGLIDSAILKKKEYFF